jgi:hypothetical protein
MDNEVCNRIVAKYHELERSGYSDHLSIQLSLALGILILICVLIWAFTVPDYVKYVGTFSLVVVILLLAFRVGKSCFQ